MLQLREAEISKMCLAQAQSIGSLPERDSNICYDDKLSILIITILKLTGSDGRRRERACTRLIALSLVHVPADSSELWRILPRILNHRGENPTHLQSGITLNHPVIKWQRREKQCLITRRPIFNEPLKVLMDVSSEWMNTHPRRHP